MANRALIRATGLRAAIRDLRAVAPEAAEEVLDVLEERAGRVARLAAVRLEGSKKPSRRRRGRGRPKTPLSASLRGIRTPRGGAVISRKPYANIIEEGGHTPSMRSSSTRRKSYIPGKHFVRDVLEVEDPLIAEDLAREVTAIFRRNGLDVELV